VAASFSTPTNSRSQTAPRPPTPRSPSPRNEPDRKPTPAHRPWHNPNRQTRRRPGTQLQLPPSAEPSQTARETPRAPLKGSAPRWVQRPRRTLLRHLHFGTREELTRPTRQNFSTNRPRLRCLSDEHGLVALGLAAPAKRRCLNLYNDILAGGTDGDGPARRHAKRHDQFVIWSSLFEHRWSISRGRRRARRRHPIGAGIKGIPTSADSTAKTQLILTPIPPAPAPPSSPSSPTPA